jgi:outer membrane protein assembly factor BamB
MSPPAGTIDLGELPRDPMTGFDPPWPGLARLRHPTERRRVARLAAITAATALVLLTAAGAGGPVRPVFQPHLTLEVIGFAHDREHLYAIEVPGPNLTRVVAYRLSDGTAQWEAPLPGSRFAWPLRHEGVLLVQSIHAGRRTTTMIKPRNGREVWRRPGTGALERIAGQRVLFSNPRASADAVRNQPPVHQLTAVDLATGQTAWRASVTGENFTSGSADSRYLVAYGEGSDLATYDLTTGQRLADLPAPAAQSATVQVVGPLVVLLDRSQRPRVLTAYDVATLSQRWRVSHPDLLEVWATACGELVCLLGDGSPRALDPATGEEVWSADWLLTDDRAGPVLISDLGGSGLAGQLLLTDQARGRSWLVDARTGEPVLDLQGWQLVQSWPPQPGAEPPVLIRPDRGATMIGALRPDRSGVRVLGQVNARPQAECSATARHVFCLAGPLTGERPQELTVWRHRLA